MSRIIYNTSDDNPVEGTIEIDNAIVPIPAGSTIVAFIQDIGGTQKLINDITILSTDDDNDWVNGKIKGVFPKASSSSLIGYEKVLVCVRATIDGHTETFSKVVEVKKLL